MLTKIGRPSLGGRARTPATVKQTGSAIAERMRWRRMALRPSGVRARPPKLGRPIFVSKRLVVLEL